MTQYGVASLEIPSPTPGSSIEWEGLVSEISSFLGTSLGLAHLSPQQLSELAGVLVSYQSKETDWLKYAHFDQYKYTRNLVDEGNGDYNLLLLCWGPGHASPIHDHAGSHCMMKVLSGSLHETVYEMPKEETSPICNKESNSSNYYFINERSGPEGTSYSPVKQEQFTRKASKVILKHEPKVLKQSALECNQVAYISDKIGMHRISNASSDKPAVSLHLYTPPIKSCRTLNLVTGELRPGGKCLFYSKDGKVICYSQEECNDSIVGVNITVNNSNQGNKITK